jgi:hypothetical protein
MTKKQAEALKPVSVKQLYHLKYSDVLNKSASDVAEKNMNYISCEILNLTEIKA